MYSDIYLDNVTCSHVRVLMKTTTFPGLASSHLQVASVTLFIRRWVYPPKWNFEWGHVYQQGNHISKMMSFTYANPMTDVLLVDILRSLEAIRSKSMGLWARPR